VSSCLNSGSPRLTTPGQSSPTNTTTIQLPTTHITTAMAIVSAQTAGIMDTVYQLKVDHDTWQAVALQYKAAFEAQTARLRELQNICFATQAELENERAQHRRLHLSFDGILHDHTPIANSSDDPTDSTDDSAESPIFGTATVVSPSRIDMSWRTRPTEDCGNSIFNRVQLFASQRNYRTALVEIERLLRGPLSPKARAEGLLLKSSILQATGPDSLYDALAACSEALEFCDRESELQSLLPKIQYQRGLYYYELRMLHQAREAFRVASKDNMLHERAEDYRRSCDEEIELLCFPNRRTAFDENRTSTDSLLAQLDVSSSHVGEDGTSRSATTDSLCRVDCDGRVHTPRSTLRIKQSACRSHTDGCPRRPTMLPPGEKIISQYASDPLWSEGASF
jgi:hypothetical protein